MSEGRATGGRLGGCAFVWVVITAGVLRGSVAGAEGSRADALARQAMTLAAKDHAAGDDDAGLLRLRTAFRGCTSGRCGDVTRASLLRDVGALDFARGERQKASVSFGRAFDLVPDLGWNALFDIKDASDEWAAVHEERAALREALPQGDLQHVPESEQAVATPIPIYAESSDSGVARVVVKYKSPGDKEFKRRNLRRFGGGWGGTLPCEAARRGLVRYFLQAFDSNGEPVGNSGDVKHLFFVPVHWEISGDPPHLPGAPPPETCTVHPGGDGSPPAEGPSAEAGSSLPTPTRIARVWFGFEGSIDLTLLKSLTDACSLVAGKPANASTYCTSPNGSDFPVRSSASSASNGQAVLGKSGNLGGGPASGDVRLLVTADYAVNSHFLTGARAGYVALSDPGPAAANDGHGASAAIHLELHETYLFGNEPLARSGFAPYAFFSAGYAKFDASALSSAERVGVKGSEPVTIWKIGGPFFVAVGGGARYAFSPRVAFLTGIRAALPFGSGGLLPSIAPELELQYGF